jgi:hypothetical protein
MAHSFLGGVVLVICGLISFTSSLVSLATPPSSKQANSQLPPQPAPQPQPTPQPPPQPPPPKQKTPAELRAELSVIINNENYIITPLSTDELVEGKKGAYYLVDLKSADTQKIWHFKLGEYTIKLFDREFAQSISVFKQNVLEQLGGSKTPYELFSRGSADRDLGDDFRTALTEDYNKSITYLPRVDEEKYLSSPKVHQPRSPATNKDLPFLRAAFMQRKLSTGEPRLKKPSILEGEVNEEQESEGLRNAMVFLFVDWEANANKAAPQE